MTYYITGANGFIGQHICRYLHGQDVKILKRRSCEIGREKKIIIHLSSYGNHYFQQNENDIIETNILYTNKLLQKAFEFGFDKFYNISTSSVALPTQTLYSASKLFSEQLVNAYHDPRLVNVRPYSVYGHGEAGHRFIPTVIRCLKSGEQMKLDQLAVHDWIHADDFVTAMFEGYTDIGTGMSYSNLEIVRMLEQISGKKLFFEEKKMRVYDSHKWICPKGVPHRSIFEGLKQTYESD